MGPSLLASSMKTVTVGHEARLSCCFLQPLHKSVSWFAIKRSTNVQFKSCLLSKKKKKKMNTRKTMSFLLEMFESLKLFGFIKCLCDQVKFFSVTFSVQAFQSLKMRPYNVKLHHLIWYAWHIVHVDHLGWQGFPAVNARPDLHPLCLILLLAATVAWKRCFKLPAKLPCRETQPQRKEMADVKFQISQ